MAMVFKAHMGIGVDPFICSDAKRFSHYVNNVRFWFAVHRPVNCVAGLTVSHWQSGRAVCSVMSITMQASPGADWPTLARHQIDKLCEEKGKERVYDVLMRAEKMGYKPGIEA